MENKYNWSQLNHLQLGRYAEYFAKMEFTLFNFEVYTSEVDDRGIDFVIRKDQQYYDVQVKSCRDLNYIFMAKDKFPIRDNMLLALVTFNQWEEPNLYLIPATRWKDADHFFISRDYEGKKSKPEWGLNLSKRNLPLLEAYAFDHAMQLFGQKGDGVEV